jgi:hypothetical protein
MTQFKPEWLEHQRKRWMRPNAHLWIRPDAYRFMPPGAPLWVGRDVVNYYGPKSQSEQPAEHANVPWNPHALDWTGKRGRWMPEDSSIFSGGEEEQSRAEERARLRAIAELRCELAEIKFEFALRRLKRTLSSHARAQAKANFNPAQPRVLAGNPDGGQWTSDGGSFAQEARVWLASDKPPEVPKERPPTAQERNRIARGLARKLGRWGRLVPIFDVIDWLEEQRAAARSSFDPPKSLEELQQTASEPRSGYDIHHNVERASAAEDGYPQDMIEAPENKVLIPRWKHWEINAWYQTENEDYGFLSPREYLRGKSWEERVRVGHKALIKFGVLKP